MVELKVGRHADRLTGALHVARGTPTLDASDMSNGEGSIDDDRRGERHGA